MAREIPPPPGDPPAASQADPSAESARDRPLRSEERATATANECAIVMLDREGRIANWPSAARRLLGYGEEEALGRPVSFLLPSEDRDRGTAESERGRALAEGSAAVDRWHQRKDGTRFWGAGVLGVFKDETDAPAGFVWVLRDDTDRKTAERELRQSSRCWSAASSLWLFTIFS